MATLQEPDLAFVPTCTTRLPVVLPDGLSLEGSIRSLRNECKLAWHARDIRRMGSATDLYDYDSDVGGSNDRRVAGSVALRKIAAELWYGQSNRCYCAFGSWQHVTRTTNVKFSRHRRSPHANSRSYPNRPAAAPKAGSSYNRHRRWGHRSRRSLACLREGRLPSDRPYGSTECQSR